MSLTIRRADDLAARAHAGQTDKAGVDYITHPRRVAAALQAQGADTITIAAALVHDVVEDTDVTLDEIEAELGVSVRAAVDAVTRRAGETYAAFIERARAHRRGRAIKRADILDNLRPGCPESLAKRYRAALERLR